MTFPGAGAQVYYNEAGEPLGWDYPAEDDPYYDPLDNYDTSYATDYKCPICECRIWSDEYYAQTDPGIWAHKECLEGDYDDPE